MAKKSLIIQNRNGDELYPVTVSSLVYDNSTGNTVEEDIQDLKLSTQSKESSSNKTTSISSSSTDQQYPSAKCVYDLISGISNYIFIKGNDSYNDY